MKKDSYFKFQRERIIHSFLLSFGGSIHDLLVECNKTIREIDPNKEIGLRALEKHLKELKEKHGYPIEKYRPSSDEIISKQYNTNFVDYPHKRVDVRKVKFLRYSRPFQLPSTIREDEYQKINEAFVILSRFNGQKGWEWLDYIYEDGRESLDLNTILDQKILFEEDFSGMLKYFSMIKDGLANKSVIEIKRIVYQGKTKVDLSVEFHPAFLKLWRNKWYAFGVGFSNGKKRNPYILPIDKHIKRIDYLKGRKFQEGGINFKGEPIATHYFKDIIGVTNYENKSPEDILLRFHSKEKFRRLDSKPPHLSWNKVFENENYIDVSLNVKINPELKNLLYEYSPGLEIIRPLELRELMRKELKKAEAYYTNL